MRHPRSLAALLSAVLVLSACADDAVMEPQLSPQTMSSLDAASPALSGDQVPVRHLVVFKGRAPSDFEARVAELGGSVFHRSDLLGYASVEGLTDEAAAELDALRDVDVAADVMLPLPQAAVMLDAVASDPSALATTPTDHIDPAAAFFYPRQWNMRVVGADAAWAAGRTGSEAVTVAILDTGIGYTHADLVGLVDLGRSVSFTPQDDIYVNAYFPGAHPVADIGYHGTHVAATVASHGLVAAGVTSHTTLMGVKVCSVALGGCPGAAIFAGIEHAVENGADVINMSLGGAFLRSANPGYVSVLNRLFNYARQNNVTVVVAAGNESIDLDRNLWPIYDEDTGELIEVLHYPSLYKTYCSAQHVVCVSATGPTSSASINGPWTNIDAPASYTNYGRSAIDVAAPGGTGGGAVWAACSTFSLVIPACQANGYAVGIGGTSMAAPHVAGLAALAVEDVGRNVAQIKAYIRNSADPIGGGNTAYYGKGRINVGAAVGAY